MRGPSLYVASLPGTRDPVAVGALAGVLAARVAREYGFPLAEIEVTEVPLVSKVKVLQVPGGPLPVPEGIERRPTSPAAEAVAPARRGDPETARKAAEQAKRLGPNRRTEILRFMVARAERGWTESEVTEAFGGVAGGTSKRIGELLAGGWVYAKGERPSITTGTAQRVVYPTQAGISWVEANPPAQRQDGGPNAR